jgi:hypothetical protein
LRARQQRPDIVAGWFASHPLEETRIRTIQQVIDATATADPSTLKRDDPAFHEFKVRVQSLPPSPRPPASRSEP